VKTDKIGKIIVTNERSTVSHIYALGDVISGGLELTPVAIQAGRLLAARLYRGGKVFMDYHLVPTTVFTPLEYGCTGLSEEEAKRVYGENSVEVYHSFFQPLEFTVAHRPDNQCFMKMIVNLDDDERVLGFHILSPNAGEITQGFALGLRLKATKNDFDSLIGIHPTIAEELTKMDITKRSGLSAQRTGC